MMNYADIKKGMQVRDPLGSLGYGVVTRVNKTTVWVVFSGHDGYKTIYDLDHLQFLEEISK